MQSLRQTISDGAQLAQVGCMIRALRTTAEAALSLDFAEGSTDAFVLQGELKEVRNKIQELDQATTLVTQATMQKADQLIYDLVTNPDGSPYPMSETYIAFMWELCYLSFSHHSAFYPPRGDQVRTGNGVSKDSLSIVIKNFFSLCAWSP